jgi:hypothetical protein
MAGLGVVEQDVDQTAATALSSTRLPDVGCAAARSRSFCRFGSVGPSPTTMAASLITAASTIQKESHCTGPVRRTLKPF